MAQVTEKPAQKRHISPFWLEVLRLALLVLVYGVAASIGQALTSEPGGIPIIWPASGIALAFLLKSPKRYWLQMAVTIYIIGAISYSTSNHTLPASLSFALIDVIEALLGTFVLHRLLKNKIDNITFGRIIDVFSLFAVPVTVSGLTAYIGASFSTLILGTPFFETWQLWWVSDGLGILLFAPLVIIWMVDQKLRWLSNSSKAIETFALVSLLILFCFLMFGPLLLTKQQVILSYTVFPFLIWLAFRFSPRSMANALVLIAGIAIWGTWQNYGIFATQNNDRIENLISLQVFLGFSTFSGLFLSAIITERKQVAEMLRTAEANYRNILENAPIGFFQSYPEGGYRSINPRMAQIFGFASPEEMLNNITDITQQIYTTPSPRQAFRKQIAENRWAVDFITQHRRKDGSPFWTSTNARAVTNEQGQTLYYEGFIQDIDERIKSEKNIQESQRFVQATMDSLSAHICVMDADGTILAVNKAWIDFAAENPPVAGNVSVGANYLTICDNTTGPEAQMAQAFAAGIRAVLSGERETFYQEYPCHTPYEQHWFMGRVLRFAEETTNRVVIAHENITERKQAEDALRESESSLKLSQQIAHVGHWTWNARTNHLTWSDEMYRIFGLDPATFDGDLNTIIAEAVHPEDREKVTQSRSNVLNNYETMPAFEHRIIIPDQSIRTVWAKSAENIVGANGEIIQISGVLQDITERKHAEDALRESETSLKFSQQVAHLGHWTWDAITNQITFSDEMYRIFGVDPATFSGNLDAIIMEAVHPDDREKVIQSRNSTYNEQKPIPIEHRIILPDQSIRTVWAEAGQSIVDKDGKIIKLNGILQDITERKQAEDALRESEASLKFSQKIAHVGNWTWDIVTNHVTWSDEMYRIFGLDPATFDGNLDKIVSQAVHPDDRQKVNQSNRDVIENKKPEPLEYRVIWPDQSVHTVWAEAGEKIINADGKIIKLSGIVQDITQRKQAENALRESERFALFIADNIPSMLAYWTTDLHCIFANKEYLTWLGRTTEQMENISAQELLGQELFKQNEPYMQAALQGKAQQFESIQTKPNGDVNYLWAQYTPHYVNQQIKGFFVLVTDITQIKHDQERLRISEEKWRSLFDILPVGISILDANRQVVDFNPALEKILDISANGLRESTYTHRKYLRADGSPMPPEEFPSRRAVTEQVVIQSAQMGIIKENDQIIWVEMSAAPLNLPDASCVIVTTDVTKRKQIEQALRNVNESLSMAQHASNAGLWDWEMTLNHYTWSPELFKLFGLDVDIIPTSETLRNSIHEQDRERAMKYIQIAVRDHLPINDEYRIVRPSGEIRWVNTLGNTTYNEAGQPQRMAGICIDITARKQIENALSESEARLKGIVVSAMDGIVMVDSSQHITLFNQSAEKMFGLPASSVIGQPLDFILPQDKHNRHKKHIEHFGGTGITTRSMSALMDITANRANGESFPLEASISQFIVNGQKFYTAILRDITERKQMEENLRGSLLEKEALLKEVHHRVKNNLQIVSSLLSMQANSAKDDKVTHALEESKNRVRAMALIHEKLYRSENLEYIQAEEYIPELTNHLTGSLIGHERMGIKFDLQIAHITFDIGKAIPCGMIITELISNALKYAFQPGQPGTIKVHLTVEDDDGRISLMVSDNGIGLPPEINYSHPDTLGLELVSILSRQLKASLQVIREPGTTFILTFRN